MKITTQDGTITDTGWWEQIRPEEDKVILGAPSRAEDNGGKEPTLVVGHYVDEDQIKRLFEALNSGVNDGLPHFVVKAWEERVASGE